MNDPVVFLFAPSPTGYLHIGGCAGQPNGLMNFKVENPS